MKIAQVSRLTDRGVALLTAALELYPIYKVLEYRLDTSTHLSGKDAHSSTGTAARAEGATTIQNDAQVPAVFAKDLQLYARSISIDKVRLADANLGAGPHQLLQFADRRVKGLADAMFSEIQTDILTGSYTANKMLGLLEFVKDAAAAGQTARLDFTTAELAAMNINVPAEYAQLNTVANEDKFIEFLMKQIRKVPGANAILCNVNLWAKLYTIAARKGAAGETRDSMGEPLTTVFRLPLIDLPEAAMPQTESDGQNADCCSLVIVRFAEELGVCHSTNAGFMFTDFENLQTKPSGQASMDYFSSLTVEKANALLRVSRIRL